MWSFITKYVILRVLNTSAETMTLEVMMTGKNKFKKKHHNSTDSKHKSH